MMRLASAMIALLNVTFSYATSEEVALSKIQWVTDLNEGLRLAKVNGKPSMLYFAADWCAPCIQLKKSVFSDSRVAEASRRLINIYIDVNLNPDAIAAYKVKVIPTIFFLSHGGEIVVRYTGDRTAAGFVKQMNTIADQHSR